MTYNLDSFNDFAIVETLDYSDEQAWILGAVEDTFADQLAFDADVVGGDFDSVHVCSTENEAGERVMGILFPIGEAHITKEQAMRFFNLKEA